MHQDCIQVALIPPGTELRLLELLGEAYAECPTYLSTQTVRGKTVERELPALRGIAMLKGMDLADPYVWQYVNGIVGSLKYIGSARLSEVERFKKNLQPKTEEEKTFIPRSGQRIQITKGLYVGQTGKCVWANKKFTKIFIEGASNSVGAYLCIATKDCKPISKPSKRLGS